MGQDENMNCSTETLKYRIDLMQAETEKLIHKEHIYKTAITMSEDAFVYDDLRTGKIVVSDNFHSMFGLQEDVVLSKRVLLNRICEEDKIAINQILMEKIDNLTDRVIEFKLADDKTWIMANIKIISDEEKNPIEKITFFRNISSIKKKNEELKYMAYYDLLTGLFNRNYFVKRLNDSIITAKKDNTSVAVLFIDIDDFKVINDSLGIVAGDEVIQMYAQDINGLLDENMFAARMSNDEFCLAIIDPIGNRVISRIYEKIRDLSKKTYKLINGRETHFTVSIGIAEFPECGDNALGIIKNAEIAVFEVKKNGKNNICYFDNQMYNDFLDALKIERQLSAAIDNEDFLLHYQPQFDTQTNKLRGVEALVRWKNDGEIISPNVFIPVSENNGTIIFIGDWVMNKAIQTLARWKKEFGYDGIMSVNISTLQIRKEDFVRKLKALIDKYYVNPEDVEIEITESVLIEDLDGIISKINTMRAYGIKVSLDDFGTGFSSLSYLKDLPIDTLKIDKSFIDGVATDSSTTIITRSVITMVKQLGVETVAEGVENREQFEYLKQMNCDNIQGYLLGKPMSEEEIEKLIM